MQLRSRLDLSVSVVASLVGSKNSAALLNQSEIYCRSMIKTTPVVRTFPSGGHMQLIDLSREIYHKMPRIMTHPPIIITPFGRTRRSARPTATSSPPPPSRSPWATTPART